MDEFDEHTTFARGAAQIAANNLRAALLLANPVEGLALLPLIERAATLANDIERLRIAAAEDARLNAAILAKAKEAIA